MRELRLLIWLQGVNALRLNELRHSGDKKQRRRLAGLLLAYALLSLVALGYTGALAYGLYQSGLHALLPAYMVLIASLLALIVTLARAQGSLFTQRGSEQLFSLPVRSSQILLARLLSLYGSALLSGLAALLPGWFFYVMAEGFSQALLLRVTGITLLTPLLPLALGVGLGALIAALSTRLRYKNLIAAALTLAALTAFMVWIYTAPYEYLESQADLRDLARGLAGSLAAAWPPVALAGRAAETFGGLALYALLNLGALALVWGLLGRHYLGLVLWFSRVQSRGRAGRLSVRWPLWALTRKELGRLLASPLYLMNTAMMAWLAPGVLLVLILFKPDLLRSLTADPQVRVLVDRLLPLAAAGFAGMSATTAVSLSMEGRNAWLMCTAPVDSKTVFLSKGLASLITAWPACLLMTTLLGLAFRPPLLTLAACLTLPLALALFSAVIGLMVDHKRARYDWDSEQAIVKNSAQTLTMVGLSMGVLLAAGLMMYFGGAAAPWLALLLSGLLMALSLLLFRRLGRQAIYQVY